MRKLGIILVVFSFLYGCVKGPEKKRKVPILGAEEILVKDQNGEDILDTVYKQINNFEFVNQKGQPVTASTFEGDIYVVDFFFTSCPTICPKMTAQMLRVYEEFDGESNVKFLSHTIDTRYDTVEVLDAYATKLGVDASKWHFVTGDRDAIYTIAGDYLVAAEEDSTAPGGYIHGGAFVLMDGNHNIRGYYDGTMPYDVDQLILDIEVLIAE